MSSVDKRALLDMIGNGETADALEILLKILPENHKYFNKFTLLKGQWTTAREQVRLGLETNKFIEPIFNRITEASLGFIKTLPEKINSTVPSFHSLPKKRDLILQVSENNSFDYIYDLFFSFSSLDINEARAICDQLRGNGVRVFFSADDMRLKGGHQFSEVVNEALENSCHFLLHCTPNSMHSEWVKTEYSTFHDQIHIKNRKNRKFLIFEGTAFNEQLLRIIYRNTQRVRNIREILDTLILDTNINLALNEGVDFSKLIVKKEIEQAEIKMDKKQEEKEAERKRQLQIAVDIKQEEKKEAERKRQIEIADGKKQKEQEGHKKQVRINIKNEYYKPYKNIALLLVILFILFYAYRHLHNDKGQTDEKVTMPDSLVQKNYEQKPPIIDSTEIKEKIKEEETKKLNFVKYNRTADRFFENKDLRRAITNYQQALRYGDSQEVRNQLKLCNAVLSGGSGTYLRKTVEGGDLICKKDIWYVKVGTNPGDDLNIFCPSSGNRCFFINLKEPKKKYHFATKIPTKNLTCN